MAIIFKSGQFENTIGTETGAPTSRPKRKLLCGFQYITLGHFQVRRHAGPRRVLNVEIRNLLWMFGSQHKGHFRGRGKYNIQARSLDRP